MGGYLAFVAKVATNQQFRNEGGSVWTSESEDIFNAILFEPERGLSSRVGKAGTRLIQDNFLDIGQIYLMHVTPQVVQA